MSKKMMLLALAVISVALVALPAVASAQEIHLEPAESFTTAGPGGELRAEGEPTVTCEGTGGSGKFDAGSTTTGSMTVDLTGCHTTVFGFTAACKSEGSSVSNTIALGDTFHLITVSSGVPGVLLTMKEFTVVCAGISTLHFTGNVIGTVTSPKCGESSRTISVSFTATSTTQNHLTYTGVKYDLQYKEGVNGLEHTAALVGQGTYTQATLGKLTCT